MGLPCPGEVGPPLPLARPSPSPAPAPRPRSGRTRGSSSCSYSPCWRPVFPTPSSGAWGHRDVWGVVCFKHQGLRAGGGWGEVHFLGVSSGPSFPGSGSVERSAFLPALGPSFAQGQTHPQGQTQPQGHRKEAAGPPLRVWPTPAGARGTGPCSVLSPSQHTRPVSLSCTLGAGLAPWSLSPALAA